MHKAVSTISKWAGAATLTGALLLIPGTGMAQGGMGPAQGGMGSPQGGQALPQPPISPGQPQMNDQRGVQDSGAGNQQMEKMESRARDSTFVDSALAGDRVEEKLGRLALEKASDPQVRQFAQRMIDDHTKLSDSMAPVAQQLGVHPSTELPKKDRKTVDKLSALSGSAFDHAYMKEMVKDHKRDLRNFQQAAASSQNPAVKAAAEKGAKVISSHLEQAEQIAHQQAGSKGD